MDKNINCSQKVKTVVMKKDQFNVIKLMDQEITSRAGEEMIKPKVNI